jgi:hypothetical protein
MQEIAKERFNRAEKYSKELDKDEYIELSLKWIKILLDEEVRLIEYAEEERIRNLRRSERIELKCKESKKELKEELKELRDFKNKTLNKTFIQRLFKL